jgi:hypothetical protein
MLEVITMCHHQTWGGETRFRFHWKRQKAGKYYCQSSWKESKIRDIFPWEDVADEAERLLDIRWAIVGRRPESAVVVWTNKVLFVLEFKRMSEQRRDSGKRGEIRALVQHEILIRSLEKVARDVEGDGGGWKI